LGDKAAARVAAGGLPGGIEDLKGIEAQGGQLHVGACVTIAALREAVLDRLPSFAEMLRRYASVQVRNAATIGGNIANGSPIGDGPPALIALGATLHLRRGDEMRSLPLEDFFLEYRKQDRKPGEFVAGVSFPERADSCAATRFPSGSTRIFRRSAGASM
jgi:xanthine dehydrogenase small subunit